MSGNDTDGTEHERVDGGLRCSVCGSKRKTRLGMERHLDRHQRAERNREVDTGASHDE